MMRLAAFLSLLLVACSSGCKPPPTEPECSLPVILLTVELQTQAQQDAVDVVHTAVLTGQLSNPKHYENWTPRYIIEYVGCNFRARNPVTHEKSVGAVSQADPYRNAMKISTEGGKRQTYQEIQWETVNNLLYSVGHKELWDVWDGFKSLPPAPQID